MIIYVPAAALSHLRPALRLADPARPATGRRERRTAGAVAGGRRAPPCSSAAPARLGRPGGPDCADPAPAREPADAPAGHPGTVLGWHRRLVTAKRAYPYQAGQPPASAEIAALTGRPATGNHGRGYQPIQGELRKPGHRVSAPAIRRIRKSPEDPPGAERHTGTTWARLPRTQAATMPATGFSRGLRADPAARRYCLSVIETGSRYVPIPGITANPDGPRAGQQIRNVRMDPADRAAGFRFPARHPAGQFTASSAAVLAEAGAGAADQTAPQPARERSPGKVRAHRQHRGHRPDAHRRRAAPAGDHGRASDPSPPAAAPSQPPAPPARPGHPAADLSPAADQAPPRPRRPHQPVPAGRTEDQARTGGRVLETPQGSNPDSGDMRPGPRASNREGGPREARHPEPSLCLLRS